MGLDAGSEHSNFSIDFPSDIVFISLSAAGLLTGGSANNSDTISNTQIEVAGLHAAVFFRSSDGAVKIIGSDSGAVAALNSQVVRVPWGSKI